ncbi:MAG TPA: TRAP transporter small permease [Devosia sp.]|nr:TRAP transporter small permease [Devosia sp.]
MRKGLDRLYTVSGIVAAGLIVLICVVVSAQVLLNFIGRIFGAAYSYTIPSYADFAGFFLAAASFLALAYTLTRGGHIRVTLLLQMLGPRARLLADLVSLALGAALSGYATWYMFRLDFESWSFGDLSFGIIAIPIWIPQLAVSIGLLVLTIAFVDLFIQSLRAGRPVLSGPGEEV